MSATILSTKKLTSSQQQLIENSGVGYAHYNILDIKEIPLQAGNHALENIIITSQKAIPAVLASRSHVQNIFCVGDVTAALLVSHGLVPAIVASNAIALAERIAEKHADRSFTYLCGNHRRDGLPELLKDKNISLNEVIVYESVIVEKSFDRTFAAVLFYSPRGVFAFAKANNHKPPYAICIGETTAAAARNVYDNVIVANKQTVENVLVTAINLLRDDKK